MREAGLGTWIWKTEGGYDMGEEGEHIRYAQVR